MTAHVIPKQGRSPEPGQTPDGQPDQPPGESVVTDVPARLDRLPWSRWHWLVLIGLGTVWILDGLEVTIVGAVGGTLTSHGSGISISTAQIGDAAGVYVAGACVGALVFGHLTDKLGRKKLFLVTLGVYLTATMLTATSVNAWMFFAFRFFTGMGIGGEYAAINSAIDELIPARVRGTVDLVVNGSYWLGTAVGAASTLLLLNPNLIATDIGWRVCFFLGATLGVGVLLVRRNLPESPRWLFTHGRADEADKIVTDVERQVVASTGEQLEAPDSTIEVDPSKTVGILGVMGVLFKKYPRRTILGLSLFAGQAFLYNAVFFTYALVLSTFYRVSSSSIGYYLIAFAVGNLLGPILLGRLFDVVGRRPMIAGTYIVSGALLGVSAWLFDAGLLNATTQTIAWVVVFFFASAGASAAYLTVSEIFPMETRALAIAVFYALGTGLGGIIGPVLFGHLIATGRHFDMAMGYVVGGSLMLAAGIVEIFFGVDAAGKSLEDIAPPVSSATESKSGSERPRANNDRPSTPRGRAVNGRHMRSGADRSGAAADDAVRRPRPVRSAWAPVPVASSSPGIDRFVDNEVDAIVASLLESGARPYAQLAIDVNARQWGPGRFRTALRFAVRSGRVTQLPGNQYEVAKAHVSRR